MTAPVTNTYVDLSSSAVRLGIIGAMGVEVDLLLERLEGSQVTSHAGMVFYEGRLGETQVVVVRGGVGKVSAGICVQILVDLFGVTHVVNTGVAGSLDASIDIGDVVVSIDAMYHDVDATVFGYAPGEIPQLGVVSFVANPLLRALAVDASNDFEDVAVHEGRVVSGDQFVADPDVKLRLARDFGGMCCEMEGAAVAQACHMNRVPFVIVRMVSDKADGSDFEEYIFFEARAARNAAAIVEAMARGFRV